LGWCKERGRNEKMGNRPIEGEKKERKEQRGKGEEELDWARSGRSERVRPKERRRGQQPKQKKKRKQTGGEYWAGPT